jgi:hypothetical protein
VERGNYLFWLGASADAETGSHPSDQAPVGLGASRFDPARCAHSWYRWRSVEFDEIVLSCRKCGEQIGGVE